MSFQYPSLPTSLVSFYHNLSVSVQNFKIRIEGSTEAYPSDIISFLLPAALVNLDSVKLHYKVTTAQNTPGAAGTHCVLSKGSTTPFTSVSCESGGTVLDSLQSGWNRYVQLIQDNTKKPEPYKKISQNEFSWDYLQTKIIDAGFAPAPSIAADAVLNVAVPAAPTVGDPWLNKGDEFVMDTWDATFIGTCSQRLFNANICPIRVLMRFEDFGRAFISDDISLFNAKYTEIYVTLQTVQLNDGNVYAEKVNAQLASGTIDYKYQRIRSFSNGSGIIDGSLTVGVPTSSLDGLISVFYDKNSLVSTECFKLGGDDLFPIPKNIYFTPSIRNIANSVDTQQFQVQNVLFPSWPASPVDQWEITQQSLKEHDRNGCEPWINSMNAHKYVNGCFFYLRLDMPGVEKVIRLRSGLNMVGTTAVISNETHGTTVEDAEVVKILYAQMSPVLQVGAGRQINIIS